MHFGADLLNIYFSKVRYNKYSILCPKYAVFAHIKKLNNIVTNGASIVLSQERGELLCCIMRLKSKHVNGGCLIMTSYSILNRWLLPGLRIFNLDPSRPGTQATTRSRTW